MTNKQQHIICPNENELARFIDGTLPEDREDYILQHLNVCENCAEALRMALEYEAFSEKESTDENNIKPFENNSKWIAAAGLTGFGAILDKIINSETHLPNVAASNSEGDARSLDLVDSNNLESNTEKHTTMSTHEIIGDDPMDIIGRDIQQNYQDTCAIKSQQLVLEDFGIHLTEEQLVDEAMAQGIYTPGSGTSPEDVGKLLTDHGIPVEVNEHGNILDLTRALAQGHKVIIGVDSGELWKSGLSEFFEDIQFEGADHALIVAGIDASTNEVILTDPGSGEEGVRYPIDKFLDAWHDSGNFMVETTVPAPQEFCPEMTGFDYDAGHISHIGNIPYDYFDQTLLPVNDWAMNNISFQDDLFNDFHNMLSGDQNVLSSGLINALNDSPFIDDHHIDLTQSFDDFIDDMVDL